MRIHLTMLLAAFALALGGCVGAPEDAGESQSWLVEVAPGTEPLESVPPSEVVNAPGCEDRLGSNVTFAIAGEGLVAALDAGGDVVCVDSVEDVQDELEEEGRSADAAALGDAYLVAIGLGYVPSASDIAAGDPSPQPSMPNGDPSPQPSMN